MTASGKRMRPGKPSSKGRCNVYIKPKKYTDKELRNCSIRDLISDIRQCQEMIANPRPFPEHGMDTQTCRKYADECRQKIRSLLSKAV